MNLRHRNFQPRDTPACLRLLRGYPEYGPGVFAELPMLWKRLFDQRAMIAAVIENCEPGSRPEIVCFGADVFVTDAFMAQAREGREPGLTARLIQRELCGRGSPILRPKAIAQANGGDGLNVVIMHVGLPAPPAGQSDQAIRFHMREAFIGTHRGYQMKEIMQEVWNQDDREWVHAYGRLRTDYSDFYRRTGCAVPRCRPCLFGITREEALQDPASIAAPSFLYTAPRLRFSAPAQELLTGAMEGETDAALASALHISLAAVKMRWRAIYERVESVAPELLPSPHLPESSRGKEKRRRIIEYVRNHPEELRPFAAASAADRSSQSAPRKPTAAGIAR